MTAKTVFSRSTARPGLLALLTGVLLASAAGCAGNGLPEGMWAVTAVEGRDLVDGSEPSVTFDGGDVLIRTGCNPINGTAHYSHDILSVPDGATTLVGCDAALSAQEQWLGELFATGVRLSLDGETMTLSQDDVTLILERQR